MIEVLKEHKQIKTTELSPNKGQLVEYGIPTNPRKITKEKYNLLLQSLDKSNLTQIRPLDVIAHEGKYIVLSGNQRLRALKELKIKEVPCNILKDDLEPMIYRQIVLQANTTYGEHDDDLLANEWYATELHEWGYDLPEWEAEKIEEETEGDDDVPESAPAITVKGDLYILGDHRLLCGDSTMIDDVERLMDGEKINLLLTDPPYNVAYEGKTKDAMTIQNDSMSNDDFRKFLCDVFRCADSVMEGGACFYIWHADLEGYNFRGACFDVGWQVRQCLIWVKNSMVMGRQDYHWKHEPCLYGWKEGGAHYWGSDRTQTTCLEFNRPTANRLHPTMKPVDLLEYQVLNNTRQKQNILDLFLGSGSTLIACEKTNRKCYGMELDEKYCDVIVKRYIEFCVKNNKEAKVYRNGELISNDVFLVG